MKKSLSLVIPLLYCSASYAQTPTFVTTIDTPSFITAVLVGLIIALGFQFLLTILSIASGISAIGDVKKNYVKAKYDLSQDGEDNDHGLDQKEVNHPGLKIVSGIGIWNLFTTTISLFGASAIALTLCPIDIMAVKIALALCIWAAFYLIVFILEYKLASSLIGGLIGTALAGIKASGEAIGSMFKSSPEQKIENILESTVAKVRSEFDINLNVDQVNDTLNTRLKGLQNSLPSYDRIKNDIATLIKDNKSGKPSPQKWMAIQTVISKVIDNNANDKSGKVDQFKTLLKDMKSAVSEGGNAEEKIEKILKASPIDNSKVDDLKRSLNGILSNNDFSEDDSNSLQQKIEELLFQSQNSFQDIQSAITSFDKEQIKKTLHEKTSLDNDQIDKQVDKVFNLISTFNEKVGITNDDVFTPSLLQSFDNRVRAFIDGTDNKELNYSLLKSDMFKIWNNPKDSLDVIKRRLDTFDSDTLVSLVTNNKHVNREDIDNVKLQLEQTKSDVLDRVNQIETKARQQMIMLEKKAVIQAENTRKMAAAAAWWLVATIIVSAGAAIGGGFLTI